MKHSLAFRKDENPVQPWDADVSVEVEQSIADLPGDEGARDVAEVKESADEDRMPGWRLALLLASSALLSGIAVVVWNRRSLQHIRQAQAEPKSVVEPGEFI